jgi:L-asparagine transporter-like permease
MQIAGLALLVAVLITMGLDREVWDVSWIVGVPWLVLVSIGYFVSKAHRKRNALAQPDGGTGRAPAVAERTGAA